MIARLAQLRRDERGVAALEFGFVTPILLLLTLGVADVSRMVSDRSDLQQAAAQTAALAIAQPQPNNTTDLNAVARAASGLPAAQVSVGVALVCNGVTQPVGTSTPCPASQEQQRYVTVTLNETFVPSWRHFGISATVPMRVSRTVRVQ